MISDVACQYIKFKSIHFHKECDLLYIYMSFTHYDDVTDDICVNCLYIKSSTD